MAFVRACSVTDLESGSSLAVAIEGVDVAVVRDEDEWYAIYDECSHAAIPLSEGDVDGCEIECWLHGSRFDLRSGKPTGLPATEKVPIYPVRVDGGEVLVDIQNPLSGNENKTEGRHI